MAAIAQMPTVVSHVILVVFTLAILSGDGGPFSG